MNNYAVIGPGGATNNSIRSNAKNMVKGTVRKRFFRYAWEHRNKSQNYAVINTEGQTVGFALVKTDGPMMKIGLIGAKQGLGVGSKLIKHIISNAEDTGVKWIYLDSVPTAIDFYKKFGFQTLKEDEDTALMIRGVKQKSPSPPKVSAKRPRTAAPKRTATKRTATPRVKPPTTAATRRSARTATTSAKRRKL
jgi:N-acetylglutamate synthase-like GNAT family acetyltransferase